MILKKIIDIGLNEINENKHQNVDSLKVSLSKIQETF